MTRHATHAGRARVALRYRPNADCFFRGVDPFERVCGLPGLLVQELVAAEPWPPLETLDPYACNLVFTALLADGPEFVAAVLGAASGQVEVWPLPASADLAAEAVTVLREQVLLASEPVAEGFAGRLGAAGLVAGNVLRRAGRIADALAVEEAVARSQRDGTAAAFLAVLRSLVPEHATPRATDGPPSVRSATTDGPPSARSTLTDGPPSVRSTPTDAVSRPPEQAMPARPPADGSPQRDEPLRPPSPPCRRSRRTVSPRPNRALRARRIPSLPVLSSRISRSPATSPRRCLRSSRPRHRAPYARFASAWSGSTP